MPPRRGGSQQRLTGFEQEEFSSPSYNPASIPAPTPPLGMILHTPQHYRWILEQRRLQNVNLERELEATKELLATALESTKTQTATTTTSDYGPILETILQELKGIRKENMELREELEKLKTQNNKIAVTTTALKDRPTTTATIPAPPKPTYAQAAKKKKTAEKAQMPVPPKILPKAQRELVIRLEGSCPDKIELTLRNEINKILEKKKCATTIMMVRKTQRNSLVLTSLPTTPIAPAIPYIDAITAYLAKATAAKATSVTINETWNKFVIHGIPTTIPGSDNTCEAVEKELFKFFGLTTMTPPRWITTDTKRQGKEHSSMLLSFNTSVMEKALGRRITLFGKGCEVVRFKPAVRKADEMEE